MCVPVFTDERVQRVAVGHPTDESAVWRQGNHRISRDRQVATGRGGRGIEEHVHLTI